MVCKFQGRMEIRRFTVLGNMNQAFQLLAHEVKVHKPLNNFVTKVKEAGRKVLN